MSKLHFSAEGRVAAPADQVYAILANYREHHPRILPDAFSDFTVDQGGVGAGTVIRFKVRAGGLTQSYHQRVSEPEPGRVLVEKDVAGTQETTFTVTPVGPSASHVRIDTRWERGGFRALVERLFAPRLLRPLYTDELAHLDRYAQNLAAQTWDRATA